MFTNRCARLLIKFGAHVTAVNSLKETAFHSACHGGSVECAQLMINCIENKKHSGLQIFTANKDKKAA